MGVRVSALFTKESGLHRGIISRGKEDALRVLASVRGRISLQTVRLTVRTRSWKAVLTKL